MSGTAAIAQTAEASSKILIRLPIAVVLMRSSSANVSFVGAFSTKDRAKQFILSRGTPDPGSVAEIDDFFSVRFLPENWSLYASLCKSDQCDPEVLARDASQPLVVITARHAMNRQRWLKKICPNFDSAESAIRKECIGGVERMARLENSIKPLISASGYSDYSRCAELCFIGEQCFLDVPLYLPGPGLPAAKPNQG